MVEIIAHRAGNSAAAMAACRTVSGTAEIDVHLHRGDVVVRHAKRLWPTSRLWERWYLLPRGTVVPMLDEAACWLGDDVPLWVDCKGPFALGLPRAVRDRLGLHRRVTMSGKAWWVLARAARLRDVRVVRSAGNRAELLLLRLPSRVALDGVALHRRLVTAPLVAELRARHGQVFCWAVTDAATARRLVGWGVDGLILDDPALMQAMSDAAVEPPEPGGQHAREGET